MELAKWLKHAYAISIVVLLHINASLSLDHHHANVTRCVERERDALLAVKRDLVDNHNLLSSWGSGSEAHNEDCCRWERVYCDNQTGHVLRLDLGGNVPWHCLTYGECSFLPALEGKISPQLIQLHDLTYLNLGNNYFNGSQIPAFIGSLTNLRYLDLHLAGFGGQIPSYALGNLTHLTYLDLSNNDFNGSQIPAFIGSLTNLRYLDLHLAGFGGQIPSHALANLTHLQYLNLRQYDFPHSVENLNWLRHLSSLKYLDLSGTNLSNIFDWLEIVYMLPNLRILSLRQCGLPPPIISNSFSQINSSKSLAYVDLSGATAITSSIFKWLCYYNTTLVYLDLSFTQLSGLIQDVFRNMSSLEYLSLSDNQFSGLIPNVFENTRSLVYLSLSSNQLSGLLPDTFRNMRSLENLELSRNKFIGVIPYVFRNMSSLEYLSLSSNQFIGLIPDVFKNMRSLVHLDLSGNQLNGLISDCFRNMSSLAYLDLSRNQLSGLIPDVFRNMRSLVYLSFFGNQIIGLIPDVFTNMSLLKDLDLSDNQLNGLVSDVFRNMRSLEDLDLSDNQLNGLVPDVFRNMSSVESLDLSGNQFIGLIPNVFRNMISLEYLSLSGNQFIGLIPDVFRNMRSLEYLSLSDNQFIGLIPDVFKNMRSLVHLDLSGNQLSGSIPDCFRNMSSLTYLDLSDNPLEGGIRKSIGQFCCLRSLRISNISLDGLFSEFFQRWLSTCPQNSLQRLDLSFNDLAGSLPDLTNFSSLMELDLSGNNLSGMIPESIGQWGLEHLDLSRNRLSGRIPQSIGQLSNLFTLNLSMNSLDGMILETHFSNLSSLYELDLSYNSLVFNVTSDWVPPFQLYSLNLRNCNVGPDFPQWLRTQNSRHSFLYISHAGISDVLPSWFWSHFAKIEIIDLSHNQIRGAFGSSKVVSFSGFEVQFSFNQFEGPIPSFLSNVTYLDLSNNKFSKTTSFLCTPNFKILQFLNLSSNNFSEELPDCWTTLVNLELLDLSNNAFSGKIPTTIGSLLRIETLKLRANGLVGELPSSLKNCTSLKVIDLGNNSLSGLMPEWLGASFPNLVILMLQSNRLIGSLPSQLCHLTRVQILDLSMNDISGTIPKCLNNLTSLSQEGNSSLTIRHSYDPSVHVVEAPPYLYGSSDYYDDDATFMWKGRMNSYKSTLGLVKRIDLSSNRLTGEIPSEITHLVGLVSLNLSRNHLTGQITPKIGNLKSLDSLDLSRNQIDGEIPTSLAQIDRLSYLDLSYNDLSGEIPTGTQLQGFDPSSYAGNPQLCGLPLKKICNPKGTSWPNVSSDQDHDKLITEGFYISLGLGFATGFWGVCGSLIFNRSWRYAYYKFLNASNDWLYVKVALIKQKLKDVLNT